MWATSASPYRRDWRIEAGECLVIIKYKKSRPNCAMLSRLTPAHTPASTIQPGFVQVLLLRRFDRPHISLNMQYALSLAWGQAKTITIKCLQPTPCCPCSFFRMTVKDKGLLKYESIMISEIKPWSYRSSRFGVPKDKCENIQQAGHRAAGRGCY